MDRRRRAHHLTSVHPIQAPAWSKGTTRSKKFAAGHAYELKVARLLRRNFPDSECIHGLWFEYHDEHGRGFAQPDFLILGEHAPIIVESKYTYTRAAYAQLDFYARLLNHLWRRPLKLLQVAKRLTRQPQGAILATCPEILTSSTLHNLFRHN